MKQILNRRHPVVFHTLSIRDNAVSTTIYIVKTIFVLICAFLGY